MKIEILMSTYNGRTYIQEQLDSLLSQSHDDFHITVRDDGSKDGTLPILEQYRERFPEKIFVIADQRNLGYPDCFWELLACAPRADMYAFCDQDDVWDSDKLRCCVEKCADIDPSTPVLYLHDYQICDAQLNVYEEHHIDTSLLSKDNIYKSIYYFFAPGFSMVLNESLRQRMLRDPLAKKDIPHDRWTMWSGLIAGQMIHDDRMLVKYRRHEKTVTQTGKNNLIMLREWWRDDIMGDRFAGWSRIARYFADCYRNEMEQIDENCYDRWRFIAGSNKGIASYFKRLFFPRRLKPTLAGEIVLRICFAMNKK